MIQCAFNELRMKSFLHLSGWFSFGGVRALMAGFGISTAALALPAAGQVAEMAGLQSGMQSKIKELDQPLEALESNYRRHLQTMADDLQSKGDLDGTLAVVVEGKAPGKTATGDKFPALKQAQQLFLTTREKLQAERTEKKGGLLSAYVKALQDLTVTLTKAGRVDDALMVRAEAGRVAASPELSQAAAAAATKPDPTKPGAEITRLVEEARVACTKVDEEKVRNHLYLDLAVCCGRAGLMKEAESMARKISDSGLKDAALVNLAAMETSQGRADEALKKAKATDDKFMRDRALADSAAVLLEKRQASEAAKMAGLIQTEGGKALHAVTLAEELKRQGDKAGYDRHMQEAIKLAESLKGEEEMNKVYAKIVTSMVNAGKAGEAKSLALLYRGNKFGTPFLSIIRAQADAGDFGAARATMNAAGFTMYPSCVAGAIIARAQADKGRYNDARATAQGVGYTDHKFIALTYVACAEGDLAAARSAAEAIFKSHHMDGNRQERYGRALAQTVVLQAKKEGLAAALAFTRALPDPTVRCLCLAALVDGKL